MRSLGRPDHRGTLSGQRGAVHQNGGDATAGDAEAGVLGHGGLEREAWERGVLSSTAGRAGVQRRKGRGAPPLPVHDVHDWSTSGGCAGYVSPRWHHARPPNRNLLSRPAGATPPGATTATTLPQRGAAGRDRRPLDVRQRELARRSLWDLFRAPGCPTAGIGDAAGVPQREPRGVREGAQVSGGRPDGCRRGSGGAQRSGKWDDGGVRTDRVLDGGSSRLAGDVEEPRRGHELSLRTGARAQASMAGRGVRGMTPA